MARIGFFADDLTGAADVLAQAHARGLEAMLVLDPTRAIPRDADVVGIAGPARSLSGRELDEAIRSSLAPLAALSPTVLIYKVCSTFDSSPTVGSIGRAIELLHEAFPAHGPIPVVPAQPGFGRYTAFSQHFGVHGGQAHRLDRHPVMSRHPATPMSEADLRLVLSTQLSDGAVPPAIHLPAYGDGSFMDRWDELSGGDAAAFVLDAVEEAHLDRVADALWRSHPSQSPALVVGSGGIMAALARTAGSRTAPEATPMASGGPTLVVSASASATTAEQIDDAVAAGWADVAIPPEALVAAAPGTAPEGAWVEAVTAALRSGRDVVAHTTRGPSDPRLDAGRSRSAAQVGGTIGRLAGTMARQGLTRDVVICGGDTSSHALLALRVRELRVRDQFVVAGPVCATDEDSDVAGCRLLLKGGQVGGSDLFRRFAGHVREPHAGAGSAAGPTPDTATHAAERTS
ncbi:four-carbon acid sugar kinase family protein [Isoptericola sp. NPDC019693]|uniref:four-carbon acid sugar kinase family protein n=1 Tax=Isoptericola sp. NPDC019693 TaxID=3364009 RepID=UPI0037AC49B4